MRTIFPVRRHARLHERLDVIHRDNRVFHLCILALSAALLFALADVPVLAEYLFARGITRFLSWLLAGVTGLLPLSLYEITALFLVAAAVLFVVGLLVLLHDRDFARVRRWLYRLAAAGLSVLIAFGVLYAPLYARLPAETALGLPSVTVTDELAYAAAEYYVEELNALSDRMERDADGNVVCPYTLGEIADRLNAAFAAQEGGYFSSYPVRPKSVALSDGMSALGITGIYFPFYAEANINRNIPSYERGVTVAHELAHAHGVSQEGEANVVAYVLCIRSQDDYLRYGGLMRAASSMLNSLGDEAYRELYARLRPAIVQEWRNASELYARYDGWLETLSAFFNDLFLKANGVPGGTRSYGSTAKSLVALYCQLTDA